MVPTPGVYNKVLAKQVAETIASRVVTDASDANILWATLPTLHEAVDAQRRVRGELEYPRDVILRSALVGPRFVRAGHAVALMNTTNERLTLRPVLQEVAHRHGGRPRILRPAALHPSDIRASWRRCARLEHGLLSEARAVGVTLDPASLRRRLLKAARAEILLRHTLRRSGLRILLVSNQHLSGHRAALRLASNSGMPTFYVPHAPVADNDMYRDLPVTTAALRGRLEVDHYSMLGAPRQRLHSAGNPAVSQLAPPRYLNGPVVLALSSWPHDRMKAVIDLVKHGIGGHTNVVVAPHPRNRRSAVRRLLPRGWSINSGRTLDLLAEGPRLLIQHSSGIAWEGLYVGVPTVQIQLDSEAPNYPLIAEPYVRTVRSAAELHEMAATLPEGIDRAGLRDWALRWCATVGADATRRIVDVLEDMPEDANLVLDAWSLH